MTPDPYAVWLSEIMLQQTTVKAVLPRYAAFLRRWPDVAALARRRAWRGARAWAGLGYYARARNLHACAREVVSRFGGRFPETEALLRTLPGIGDYTAAAIAAIAFGAHAHAGRRQYRARGGEALCRDHAASQPPSRRSRRWRQASRLETRAWRLCARADGSRRHDLHPAPPGLRPLSDCGRTAPRHAAGLAEVLPYREAKAERPMRRGTAFVALRADGAVLLRERPLKGLLGGMLETPSSPWIAAERTRTRRSSITRR